MGQASLVLVSVLSVGVGIAFPWDRLYCPDSHEDQFPPTSGRCCKGARESAR